MENEWRPIVFDVAEYRDTGTFIIRGSDDISQLLDDHLAMTQSMSFSVFKKPFEDRIARYHRSIYLLVQKLMFV